MPSRLAMLLLATAGVAVAQTTVYETKGPDGPSFSDQSSPGAVTIDVPPPNAVGPDPATPDANAYKWRTVPASPAGGRAAAAPPAPPAPPAAVSAAPSDADEAVPVYGTYPPLEHPAAAAAAWDRAYDPVAPGLDPRVNPPGPVGNWRVPPPAAGVGERGRR